MTFNTSTTSRSSSRRGLAVVTVSLIALVVCHLMTSIAHAAPTQEEVFRSISESVGSAPNPGKALAVLAVVVGVLVLLILLALRRQQAASPKPVNHYGRLVKEIMPTIGLHGSELKQLKILAEESTRDGTPPSPLALLLCPSAIAKAMPQASGKIDRDILANLARRIQMPE